MRFLYLVFFLLGAIWCSETLACDEFGNPMFWKSAGYDEDFNSLYQYIPAEDNCGCTVQVKLIIDGDFTKPGYTISDFSRWYNGALNHTVKDTTVLAIGDSGCFPINIKFYEEEWPWGANEPGKSRHDYRASGTIFFAEIDINLVNFPWLTGESSEDSVSTIIGHEVGHCIGMEHYPDIIGEVMTPVVDGIHHFNAQEIEDANCVYDISLSRACASGASPAFFGEVACTFFAGQGAVLSIQTLLEEGVNELVVKRGSGFSPPYNEYLEVGSFILDNHEGATYNFVDPNGQLGDPYLLECISTEGPIDNIAFIHCGNGDIWLEYPQGAVEDMRSYNQSQMYFPKWRQIAAGERAVPSVTYQYPADCDFLIIAYDDFIQDTAPICDYWEFMGIDVELAKCNGQKDTYEQVKSYISRAHNKNALQAVWLIGSPTPDASWEGTAINLVPTNYGEKDFAYSDIDDDGIMDVPVGRLPARAIREVVFYVNKELHYHRETCYLGKKDPAYYGTHQLNSVPDNYASGDWSNWTPAQYKVGSTGSAIYSALANQVGYDRVESLLTTSLSSWFLEDDAAYYEEIKEEIFQDLEGGRHVVFGVSLHNSYANQYGVVTGSEWQTGLCLPGDPCSRPCETFWITPECFSTSLSCNVRTSLEEPGFLISNLASVYELFLNKGLLIFGSSGVTWHDVTEEVAILMAERILVEDPSMGHAKSVGRLWMDIYNELSGNAVAMPLGLTEYGIFGDPMLFVRDIYDATSATDGNFGTKLSVIESPNPFNGKIQFRISGLQPGGGGIRLYDIQGRLVKALRLPIQSGTTIMTWDGRDSSGRNVASGIYFAVVTNQGQEITKKMAYIK